VSRREEASYIAVNRRRIDLREVDNKDLNLDYVGGCCARSRERAPDVLERELDCSSRLSGKVSSA
jgi:hypothetical protein